MNVAITGGSGFIGSHLLKMHIDRADNVRILTPNKYLSITGANVLVGDLT